MQQDLTPSPARLYEHFFGPAIFRPLSEILVRFAPPPHGGCVLDLACGTGFVARTISPLIGVDGSVVAVDINPRMLAVAQEQPLPAGASIEWLEADATEVAFDASRFDAAYCQQGLQFFSDRAAALRTVHGAVRPGGFFAVAAWKPVEQHPLLHALAEIEARHLSELGVTYEDVTAPFSLGEENVLRHLLMEAGFERITLEERVVAAELPGQATFVRNMETAYGAVIPAFVEDRAAFERFVSSVEREARSVVNQYTSDDKVRFEMPTNVALAHA